MLLLQDWDCSFSSQKGQVYWGFSENTADGPLSYQREQKVMPHPGRMWGWAHRSRACLRDLGHVPCHLSVAWGYHQPCQVVGDRKVLFWSVVRLWPWACLLEFHFPQCWWLEQDAFFSGSASGRALLSKARARAGDQYPLAGGAVLLEAFRGWEPCQAPASAAQGAEHVPAHRPLCGGDVQVNEQDDCNNLCRK